MDTGRVKEVIGKLNTCYHHFPNVPALVEARELISDMEDEIETLTLDAEATQVDLEYQSSLITGLKRDREQAHENVNRAIKVSEMYKNLYDELVDKIEKLPVIGESQAI